MINKIYNYINSYKLIKKGDRILIGVSGGADSVCLMHILYELYKDSDVGLFAVHVHHGIRDTEADRDEAFVKTLCDNLGIKFLSYHVNVKTKAAMESLSEEEAGRKARHEAFLDASKKYECNKVAIAHNKNDNAETILFNLFRGSGLKGLTGIDPLVTMKTDAGSLTIIRPLLSITREEIEAYLSDKGILYQSDSTNFQDIYSRNKIRNKILTYAKNEINCNVIEHITNAAYHLNEAHTFIEKYIRERYIAIVSESEGFFEYDVNEFIKEEPIIQKGIVLKILEQLTGKLKDIESKHVDEVLLLSNKQVGKKINLPYGIIAIKKYDKVNVYIESDINERDNQEEFIEQVDIIIPGRTYIKQYDLYIETEIIENKKNMSFPKNSCMKWFDYDKIENTLKLRTRTAGDYLQINDIGGRKKLKDYFIDLKIPKEDRDKILLVADGNHILWILGYNNRISEKYKINNQTKKILSMILINAKEKKDGR